MSFALHKSEVRVVLMVWNIYIMRTTISQHFVAIADAHMQHYFDYFSSPLMCVKHATLNVILKCVAADI